MAVGFRNSSSTGVGDNEVSSINVPVPTGGVANDIAVVALEQWDPGNPVITAGAFTQFLNLVDPAAGGQKLNLFWKRLSGTDSGNYPFSWTSSQWTIGHCVLISGAKTTGDPIGANVGTATAASGLSIPTASLPSSLSFQPFLLHFVANENSATEPTPPTSFTKTQESNYLKSNYRIPGTTGSFSAPGGSLSVSTLQLAALLAIEPDAGGAPPAVVVPPIVSSYSSYH